MRTSPVRPNVMNSRPALSDTRQAATHFRTQSPKTLLKALYAKAIWRYFGPYAASICPWIDDPEGCALRSPLRLLREKQNPNKDQRYMKNKEKPTPHASDSLKLDAKKTLSQLEEFLSRKLEESGFNGYIIGLSGGIDTSVAAAIAVRAVGAARVQSICMPYKAAQTQAARDARLVATWLGIKHAEVELWRVIDAYYSNIKAINPVRTGNKMARERMAILFDQAFDARLLVLGATNRSEMALGYATWFGETACSINLLGQLYKTQVRQLAVELGVPEKIRVKPPSADLWLGHTDEDELGITFDELDKFLSMVIDQGIVSRDKLKKAGFSDLTIDRTLAVSHKFYFKRRCPETADLGLPDIPDNITLKK